jgi:hypothetical protein
MKARGGFIEVAFLLFLYLILLLRSETREAGRSAHVMAFLAGFSTYVNALSLPFLALASVISYLRTNTRADFGEFLRSKRALGLSLLFLLGFSPVFVDNALHGRMYGMMYGLSLLHNWVEKLDVMFLQVIPLLFGVHLRGLANMHPFALAEFVLFLLTTMAFVYAIVKYRKFFVSLFLLRSADYPKAFTLVGLLPPFLLLWFVSSYSDDIMTIRYFVVAIFLIPVYLTEFTVFLARKSRAVAGAYWLLVILAGVGSSWQFLVATPEEADYSETFHILIDHGHDAQPLVDFLIENDLRVGYADYWIQHNIVYLSREGLIYATPTGSRYLPYLERAKIEPFPTHIDFRSNVPDPDGVAREYSEQYGARYQWRALPNHVVFHLAADGERL